MSKKGSIGDFLIGLIVLIPICALVFGTAQYFMSNFFESETYELSLPESGEVSAVNLVKSSGEEITLTGEEAGEVFTMLKGEDRTTSKESVQDMPVNVKEWIQVELVFASGENVTLFVYQKQERFYLEQPYNGVYQISYKDYSRFEEYAGQVG